MRSRSDAKKAKKISTAPAAERTVPIVYDDPEASVKCTVCEEVAAVKTCTRSDKGALECPACGAPIETVPMKTTQAIEEDIPFPENKTITSPRKPVFETKNEIAKQDAMLKDAVLPSLAPSVPDMVEAQRRIPAHEAPPKAYCGACGTELAIVNGKLWANCGHNVEPVDTPTKAERYSPPGGSARATVLGRTLRVTRGKANFGYPGMNFGGFSIGPYDVTMEVGPQVNLVEAARGIRADLKKIADEAFEEEMKWYEQKLAQLAKAAAGE